MTRLFQRGELRHAVLTALAEIEPANGYTIMQALAEAIEGPWRPSPGAIYPAILGLEDAGLVTGADDGTGSRVYRLTDAGHRVLVEVSGTLAAVADRARRATPRPTVGSLLDAFGAGVPGRARRVDEATAESIVHVLDAATAEIDRILNRENDTDG